METKPHAKVDQRVFNAIKTLFSGGASIAECSEYMGLSTATVKYIKSADTFEEYKNIIAAVNIRKKEAQKRKAMAAPAPAPVYIPSPIPVPAPVPEPKVEVVKEIKQSVTVQTTHYVSQKMDKIEELLTSISAKLAYIVEDLYGTKEERK